MAKTYSLFVGIFFLILALLEILGGNLLGGRIQFTVVLNSLHWVIGVLGLAGYWFGLEGSRLYSKIFGIFFLLLFILGMIVPVTLTNLLGHPTSAFNNIIHLVAGLIGVYAGFLMKDPEVVV